MNEALASRIKANMEEYYRLLEDSNYTNVRFNEKTGGLSAIHIEHNFDPTIGIFGIPRGDYERISIDVLYEYGKTVVLGSEKRGIGKKAPEGLLDGKEFDIKGIEGTGKRNIIDKISDASYQGVETVVLYFHDADTFNLQKIINAYKGYLKLSKTRRVQNIYYIVDNKLHKVET